MKKEFTGVSGFTVRLEDNEHLFVKSSITKENLHLAHLEWIKLGEVNSQGRGTFIIVTDDTTPFQIVFKKNQYDEMKELYEILLPIQSVYFSKKKIINLQY
ncbi:hypothetical protein [Coprobacillus cateniformis]|uniref:hypothetical protein n=1 Tax=Coprobacillus cateniformis TaxID=100884 RepID=UPI0039A1C4DE